MFGVALGVMTLIIVLGVMNGFEKDLKGALQGANGHLSLTSIGSISWEGDNDPAFDALKNHPDVLALSPYTTSQALIMGPFKPVGALVKGIQIDTEPKVSELYHFLRSHGFEVKRDNRKGKSALSEKEIKKAQGILNSLRPHRREVTNQAGETQNKRVTGIILGSQLARNLGAEIGSFVTLVTPKERATAFGPLPRAKKFYVVGFYESGLMGYDEALALVDLEIAQKLEQAPGQISGLTLRLKNGADSEDVKASLKKHYPFPYHLVSWKDQNKNLFAMFQLEKMGLAIVLTLIILIAAFNIISSLVILVMEKKKDIAILKAMGAKDSSIQWIFFRQGAVIGLAGTLVGEILGILVCFIIQNFDVIDVPAGVYVGNRIPMHVEYWQLGLIAFVSLVICFTVTLFPARKAASTDPVAALRSE